jgi:hypothetical protein
MLAAARQAMSRSMKFSWKALFLAPLPVPLIFGALLEISNPGRTTFTSFLFFSALGSVLSYGITIFIFLPCLFLVSRFTPLTAGLTGFLGTVLGLLVYVPVMWQSYRASGDNSGPPQITFGEYLRQYGLSSDFWAFLVAGLVTAMLYWLLSNKTPRRNDQPIT